MFLESTVSHIIVCSKLSNLFNFRNLACESLGIQSVITSVNFQFTWSSVLLVFKKVGQYSHNLFWLSQELRQCLGVLERFRSSYLEPLLDLSQQIEQEASIAEENLKYLTVLEGPCQELSKCSIRDIPLLYPKILRCIRMIWKLSPFYNTEKITSLLCLVCQSKHLPHKALNLLECLCKVLFTILATVMLATLMQQTRCNQWSLTWSDLVCWIS